MRQGRRQLTLGSLIMVFDEPTVTLALQQELKNSPKAHDAAYMGKLTQIIRGLTADHYRRLMYVGQYKDLCDYDMPTFEMARDLVIDAELARAGLVTLAVSPPLLADITAAIATDKGAGRQPPNGNPRFCYLMTLTGEGADVKTALVNKISSLLGSRPASP
jgi:hypothetical protein